ncbi:uncharacterized protein LOC144553267 [Carex rostrata]
MDVFQNYILVIYNPFDVHIFHVKISGGLVPAGSPVIQREKGEEALRLAHLSAEKQHFSHCFEWLLFKNWCIFSYFFCMEWLLWQATLDESLYELAGELVRFLLRSGREFESATSDSDRLSPRFLSYFLFRSPSRRQSSDLKSGSFKELSPHIASVKNILENHASYLMSGKELSKLVAFVKGTQFDIVEYLQREKLGSAQLDNFASALELIGQKVFAF